MGAADPCDTLLCVFTLVICYTDKKNIALSCNIRHITYKIRIFILTKFPVGGLKDMVINLFYAMNKKYEKWFALSLHSVMRNNKDIHLFLYSEDTESIKQKAEEFKHFYSTLKTTIIEDKRITDWINLFSIESRGYSHVSKEGFVRLFFSKLPLPINKVIYFDCDIINTVSLNDLWNTDMKGKSFLGCRGYSFSDTQAKELNNPYYVLSGMLVMDLERLRKINAVQYIQENYKLSLSKPAVPSADETILNDLFFKEIELVSESWNYCYNRDYGERALPKELIKNWHICGEDKTPMKQLYISQARHEFK